MGRRARSLTASCVRPSRAMRSAPSGASATSSPVRPGGRRRAPRSARTRSRPAHRDQARVAGARADERNRHCSVLSTSRCEEVPPLLVGRERAPSPTAAAPEAARLAQRCPRADLRSRSALRSRCASAGDAPPVETATAIGPSRWTAGRMKLQSSGHVGDVAEQSARLGVGEDAAVQRLVRGRRDHEEPPLQVGGARTRASTQLDVERREASRRRAARRRSPARRTRRRPCCLLQPDRAGRRPRGTDAPRGRGRPCSTACRVCQASRLPS